MWDVFMPLDPDVPVPENEDVVFAGATHARVAEMLTGHPLLRKHGVRIARDDIAKRGGPYVALVFRTPRMAEERGEVPPGYRGGEELPEGLVWDVVRTDVDVEGVMANNALVRVREQLQGRQNVAVRCTETGELVGWAYHGMDGSVKTLFVRPEWRRKGLARKVVRRLVADADWGDGWCRADVAPDSELSRIYRNFNGWCVELMIRCRRREQCPIFCVWCKAFSRKFLVQDRYCTCECNQSCLTAGSNLLTSTICMSLSHTRILHSSHSSHFVSSNSCEFVLT